MKKFIITLLSAACCGLILLSACSGAKKNEQGTEKESEVAVSGDNSPMGFLMPTVRTNDYCGDFSGSRVSYGYLMPEKKLFLLKNGNSLNCGIDIYTYVMEGDKIVCTPGHFVMIMPRSGEKVEVNIRKSSKNNTPSLTFVPTPNCENSDYVATETVAGSYFYLCGDGEARYQFEDLFEDERCAEFKNLVDNYGAE